MKYRALESFSGKISMYKGEIRELTKEVAKDLLKANYIEKIKDNTKEDSPEEDDPKDNTKEDSPEEDDPKDNTKEDGTNES